MADVIPVSSLTLTATYNDAELAGRSMSLMQVRADALPRGLDLADEQQLRQSFSRAVQDKADVQKRAGNRSSPDAHYNAIGAICVALAWLAFYVVAALGAEAGLLGRASTSLNVFQMHLTIGTLPVQEFHDRSVVFSDGD
jgi:hypothetical protein